MVPPFAVAPEDPVVAEPELELEPPLEPPDEDDELLLEPPQAASRSAPSTARTARTADLRCVCIKSPPQRGRW
jgi:hypothetical protein